MVSKEADGGDKISVIKSKKTIARLHNDRNLSPINLQRKDSKDGKISKHKTS
jgi:hypothetical protein